MRKIHIYFLSVTSGILLSLSWIFPELSWVLLFAFVPLLIGNNQLARLNESRYFSSSFCLGFIAFLIWNILSTWWIAYASLTGMLFVTSLNALFMSIIWWIRCKVHRRLGAPSGYFSLIVFWIAFEFLNHHWILPWPWLTLGNGFANSVKIIQWYEFTGVLGGTVWVLLSNILIFKAINSLSDQPFVKSVRSASQALFVIIFPLVLSLHLYSNYTDQGIIQHVVVLQPNIDPYTEKFSGMSAEDQINRLIQLAESTINDSSDLVIAPETALPPLWEDSLVQQIPSLLPIYRIIQKFPDVRFIAGAITQRKFRNDESVTKTARRSVDGKYYFEMFNSALMIDRVGGIQFSHKNILVAGVEKDPFQEYLSFLPNFMLDLGGTKGVLASGEEPKVFEESGGKTIGPVICFESVFGEHVRQLVKKGAKSIVVITNDGWWKDTPGVWQHFGYSKLRAIENRRSIARSANTGISGVINQRGDVIAMTCINTCAAIGSSIRMNKEITFYTRYGDFLGWISLLLSVMIGIYLLVRRS